MYYSKRCGDYFINEGTTQRLQFGKGGRQTGRRDAAQYISRPTARTTRPDPNDERHPLGSQAFYPLKLTPTWL